MVFEQVARATYAGAGGNNPRQTGTQLCLNIAVKWPEGTGQQRSAARPEEEALLRAGELD